MSEKIKLYGGGAGGGKSRANFLSFAAAYAMQAEFAKQDEKRRRNAKEAEQRENIASPAGLRSLFPGLKG